MTSGHGRIVFWYCFGCLLYLLFTLKRFVMSAVTFMGAVASGCHLCDEGVVAVLTLFFNPDIGTHCVGVFVVLKVTLDLAGDNRH